MTRKLKVFGFTTTPFKEWEAETRQVRVIVAATSRAKAAQAFCDIGMNVTVLFLTNYASETGNAHEIEIATARPETVFWASEKGVWDTRNFIEAAPSKYATRDR